MESSERDHPHLLHQWLIAVYGRDEVRPQPQAAARLLGLRPAIIQANPIVACAVGDESVVREAIAADAAWVNQTPNIPCPECGADLGRPPLVAVTHSSLVRVDGFRDRLYRTLRLLLDAGATPDQVWVSHSGCRLSALYGAAGFNHDVVMTRMLLEAGAHPDDNESLYHSTETRDLTCTRLLLDAGAVVEGTNAVHHKLDIDDLDGLRLLLSHVKDVEALSANLGSPLLWAIRRRRSRAHVEALLDAGVDPHALSREGVSAFRLASMSGLTSIADLLRERGAGSSLTLSEQFVGACARADRSEAATILAAHPTLFDELTPTQLQQLPNQVEAGNADGARVMVELGWPIAIAGGDWKASALNLAVFRGDAALTRFLLEHGASWTERHGYGDNANGTLSWASRNKPFSHGDWVGCARALHDHGMPLSDVPGDYAPEVAALGAELRASSPDSTNSQPRHYS